MYKLKEIFPIRIYESEYPNFSEIKDSIINSLEKHFSKNLVEQEFFDQQGKRLINRTTPDLHKDPELKTLVDFIELHSKEYWKILNFTKKTDPYIMHMWANSVPKGGFTPSHNHNPVPIGGVLYINANPKMGNLHLEDPLDLLNGRMPVDFHHNTNSLYHQEEVTDGKLLLFPGWMKHHTESNAVDQDRIVISFNIGSWFQYLPNPENQNV